MVSLSYIKEVLTFNSPPVATCDNVVSNRTHPTCLPWAVRETNDHILFLKKLITSFQMSWGNSWGSCILQTKTHCLCLNTTDTDPGFCLGGEATTLHLPQLWKQLAECDSLTWLLFSAAPCLQHGPTAAPRTLLYSVKRPLACHL